VLKGLIVFGLTRRPIILLCMLVFVGAGLVAFTKLNIEAYPNPAPVILEITAQAAGQSAEEMERYYTIPMEVGLSPTPGVDVIRSTSFYDCLSFASPSGMASTITLPSLRRPWPCSRTSAFRTTSRLRSRDRAWSEKSIATSWSARRISG
jgi:AcrB/AcrD/AcrF family